MGRADVVRADLERIGSMPDAEFREKWGDWCRRQDRDVDLMRQRWIGDLEYKLPHAEREDEAVEELVAAKDAYRDDPSDTNKQRKAAAVKAVQDIRFEERATRGNRLICGDAFMTGG